MEVILGYFIGILSAVFWGVGPIFTKRLLTYFTPLEVAVYRYLIAGLFLLGLVVITNKSLKVERADLPKIIVSSILGYSLYSIVAGYALFFISASFCGILNGMIPIVTMLIERVFRKKPLGLKGILSLVLSVGGVVFLSFSGTGSNSNPLLGIGLVLIGILGWVAFTYMSENLNEKYGCIEMLTLQSLIGSVLIIPFSYKSMLANRMQLINGGALLDLLILGIIVSGIGYICYMIGVEKTNLKFMSFVMNLLPVVALIAAALFLNESIRFFDLIGVSMIIGSLFYVAHGNASNKNTSEIYNKRIEQLL